MNAHHNTRWKYIDVIPDHYYYAGLLFFQAQQQVDLEKALFDVTASNVKQVVDYAIALYSRDQEILTDSQYTDITQLRHSVADATQLDQVAHCIHQKIKQEHQLIKEKSFVKYAALGTALWSLMSGAMYFLVGCIPDAEFSCRMSDGAARVTSALALSITSLCIGCFIIGRKVNRVRLGKTYQRIDAQHEVLNDLSLEPVDNYLKQRRSQEKKRAEKSLSEVYLASVAWQITYTTAQILLELLKVSSLSLGPVGIAVNISIGVLTGMTSGAIEYVNQCRRGHRKNTELLKKAIKEDETSEIHKDFQMFVGFKKQHEYRLSNPILLPVTAQYVEKYLDEFYQMSLDKNRYGLNLAINKKIIAKNMLTGFIYGAMPGVIGGVCLRYFSGLGMVMLKVACTATCGAMTNLGVNRAYLKFFDSQEKKPRAEIEVTKQDQGRPRKQNHSMFFPLVLTKQVSQQKYCLLAG